MKNNKSKKIDHKKAISTFLSILISLLVCFCTFMPVQFVKNESLIGNIINANPGGILLFDKDATLEVIKETSLKNLFLSIISIVIAFFIIYLSIFKQFFKKQQFKKTFFSVICLLYLFLFMLIPFSRVIYQLFYSIPYVLIHKTPDAFLDETIQYINRTPEEILEIIYSIIATIVLLTIVLSFFGFSPLSILGALMSSGSSSGSSYYSYNNNVEVNSSNPYAEFDENRRQEEARNIDYYYEKQEENTRNWYEEKREEDIRRYYDDRY